MMLYMIGGSPCSGKSTIASLLARQYKLLHIKLDDLVDEMMSQASADSQPICLLRQGRNPEQIWMRNPEEMADKKSKQTSLGGGSWTFASLGKGA